MGASIAAGPHSTSTLLPGRATGALSLRLSGRRSGREAPGLLPIRACGPGLPRSILPPARHVGERLRARLVSPAAVPATRETGAAGQPWAFPPHRSPAPDFVCAKSDGLLRRRGVECTRFLASVRVGWRQKPSPRGMVGRHHRHPVSEPEGYRFAHSQVAWKHLRLVTLQTIHTRILVRKIAANQWLALLICDGFLHSTSKSCAS